MCPCDPDVTGKVYANGGWENGLVKPFVTDAQGKHPNAGDALFTPSLRERKGTIVQKTENKVS